MRVGLLNSLRSASTHTTDIDTFVLSWCKLYLVLTNPPGVNQSIMINSTLIIYFVCWNENFLWDSFVHFFSYLHFVYNWFWYVISVVSCLKCYSSLLYDETNLDYCYKFYEFVFNCSIIHYTVIRVIG